MTVLHERDFGILASVPVEQELVPVAAAQEDKKEEKPKRVRKKTEKTEESS
jgi:hypothetical protein